MRRKDREVTDLSEIIEIMKNCDVCRLALNDDGFPYILPLNFGMAVNGDKITLYFHSALEGYKVGLIRKDNRASFEMDCKHELQYFEDKGYCTMAYESVIGKGHQLQQELIDRTESGTNYDDLAEEILRLRELQEQAVMDDATKAAHRERIQELLHFINSQPRTITEFDEALVRKLLKDVKICDVFIEFRFKSGTSVIIEK